MMKQIFKYIDFKKDYYIQELLKVCRQPSISVTGEGIQEMVEMLVSIIGNLGAHVDIVQTQKNPIIHAVFQGKSNKKIMFYNHYDVQPPGPAAEWSVPPFAGNIIDDTIYCRGVADNKGNLMSRLFAVESLLASDTILPVTVVFIIEGEEEIGSPSLEKAVEDFPDIFQADGIVWEGGFKDFSDRPEIYLGLKGWCGVEVTARTADHPVHSSFATIAQNAIWNLIRTINTLQNSDGRINVDGFYDDVIHPSLEERTIVEQIPYEWDQFFVSHGMTRLTNSESDSDLMLQHLYQPTCNIIGINGGYTDIGSKTILPNEATAKIGFRLVPNQNPVDILLKVEKYLKKNAFGEINITPMGHINYPCRTSVNSNIAQAIIRAAKDAYEQMPIVYPTAAGTGSMFKIAHKLNIPAVLVGCSNANSNIHAPNENLRISKDFIPGIKHMAAIIKYFGEMD